MYKIEYSRFYYRGKLQFVWGFTKGGKHFLSGGAVLRNDLGRKGSLHGKRKTILTDYSIAVSGRRKRRERDTDLTAKISERA